MLLTTFLLGLALLAPATALALYARPVARGRWPVLRGVRRGAGATRDIRFAAFVSALGALVLSALAGRPEGWSTLTVLLASVSAAPVLTAVEAALADLLLRLVPGTWEAARYAASLSTQRSRRPSAQRQLVEQAHCEVAAARTIVQDPSLLAALDTLEEAVSDYARAIETADDTTTLVGLRARLRGVTALTRSCLDDATPNSAPVADEEVARVCQQLERAGSVPA